MKKIMIVLACCVFTVSLNAMEQEQPKVANMFSTIFEKINADPDLQQNLLKERKKNVHDMLHRMDSILLRLTSDEKSFKERYPIFCKSIGDPVYQIVYSKLSDIEGINLREELRSKIKESDAIILSDIAKFTVVEESDAITDESVQIDEFKRYILAMLAEQFSSLYSIYDKNLQLRYFYHSFTLMSYCEDPKVRAHLALRDKGLSLVSASLGFWERYIEDNLSYLIVATTDELNWYKDYYLKTIVPAVASFYQTEELLLRKLCSFQKDFEEYFSPNHTGKALVALALSGATAGISYKKLLPKSAQKYLDTHPQAEKILYVGCGSVAAVAGTYLGYRGYKKLSEQR